MTSTDSMTVAGEAGAADPLVRAADRIALYRRHANGRESEVLGRIADGLRAGGGTLVGTELASAYPAEALLPDPSRLTKAVRWVELIRDGALFAPVAVTWLRLSDALNAYQRAHSQLPFLTAWEDGVGGASTLSATAWDVARIVLGVILLTVVLHVLEARLERRAELREALARDLSEATWTVATYSAPSATANVSAAVLKNVSTQIAASGEQLRHQLSSAAGEISRAVESGPASPLGKALGDWQRAAQLLFEVASTLKSPQEMLDAALRLQEGVTAEMKRLNAELAVLVRTLHEATESSSAQAHSHRSVSDEVAAATRELGTALDVLNSRAEVFGEIVDRLRHIVSALDGEGPRRWDGRPFDADGYDGDYGYAGTPNRQEP